MHVPAISACVACGRTMQIYLLVNLMVKLINDQVNALHDDGHLLRGSSDTSVLLFTASKSNSNQLTVWIVSRELLKYAKVRSLFVNLLTFKYAPIYCYDYCRSIIIYCYWQSHFNSSTRPTVDWRSIFFSFDKSNFECNVSMECRLPITRW